MGNGVSNRALSKATIAGDFKKIHFYRILRFKPINSIPAVGANIFQFNVPANTSGEIALSQFRGKSAYLIVNVASEWGLTNKNYKEMQILYEKHRYAWFRLFIEMAIKS